MGVPTFTKGISLQENVIARFEFELIFQDCSPLLEPLRHGESLPAEIIEEWGTEYMRNNKHLKILEKRSILC